MSELQSYTSKYSHDWRKWDQKEVEVKTQLIKDSSMTITTYLSDFMVLIHNELLSGYFGHKRPTRKTLDPSYKVLTKDGIVENLDHDLIQNTEKWKAELLSAVDKSKLPEHSAILDNVCPQCTTAVLVIEAKDLPTGRYFWLACGHSITIQDEEVSS